MSDSRAALWMMVLMLAVVLGAIISWWLAQVWQECREFNSFLYCLKVISI